MESGRDAHPFPAMGAWAKHRQVSAHCQCMIGHLYACSCLGPFDIYIIYIYINIYNSWYFLIFAILVEHPGPRPWWSTPPEWQRGHHGAVGDVSVGTCWNMLEEGKGGKRGEKGSNTSRITERKGEKASKESRRLYIQATWPRTNQTWS